VVCVAGPPVVPCDSSSCKQQAGAELWRTDGTAEGTQRLEDIYEGSGSSNPAYMTSFDGYLYFAATSMIQGRELWRSGGGPGEAQMVSIAGSDTGIFPGSGSADPQDITVSGALLFFAASDPLRGRELWFLLPRGSSAGYLKFIDIVPGTDSSFPSGFCAALGNANSGAGTGVVFFQAFTAATGFELFVSDGTALGDTFLI